MLTEFQDVFAVRTGKKSIRAAVSVVNVESALVWKVTSKSIKIKHDNAVVKLEDDMTFVGKDGFTYKLFASQEAASEFANSVNA